MAALSSATIPDQDAPPGIPRAGQDRTAGLDGGGNRPGQAIPVPPRADRRPPGPPAPQRREASSPNAAMVLSPEGRRFLARQEGTGAGTLSPHWPGNRASGVSLGFGYDMGARRAGQIAADLKAIGVESGIATRVAGAAGLRGADAARWVAGHAGVLTLTPARRDALFVRTVQPYVDAVRRNVRVPLNPNEFDALVSFAYNVGPGAFANSPVIAALNAGDRGRAMDLLADARVGSDPRTVAGLRARRRREVELFRRPYDDSR
jgi:GH24 family phage-related lysozyme (muramidase)